MTIVDTARAALIAAERLAADGMVPVPQDFRQQGHPGLRRDRADAESSGVGVREATQRRAHRRQPDFFVATMSVAERAGRIYVDYNQNLAARNTIAPYSLRGRERPWVATPLTWDEVAGDQRR